MESPMESLYETHQATMETEDGLLLPRSFGGFEDEVNAMENGVGVVCREDKALLLIRGADAGLFLSGLVTSNVSALKEGQHQSALLCGTKGKILDPVGLARLKPDQFLLMAEASRINQVAGHLEAYHIREAVKIGKVPFARVDLVGAQVETALKAMGLSVKIPISHYLEAPLLVMDSPLGSTPRVLMLLPEANAASWTEALLESMQKARLVGFDALEEVRINAGVPRWRKDYDTDFLPAEAAAFNRIAFDKGCYVGQEIHARLHHRGHVNRKLVGIALADTLFDATSPPSPSSPPSVGSELFLGDQAVGHVTSLASLGNNGMRRGIALVRYQALVESNTLSLSSSQNTEAVVEITPLSTDLQGKR